MKVTINGITTVENTSKKMNIVINGKTQGGDGAVESVNGQTGVVVLTASDIDGVEMTANKVTSMSSESTDTQYPSAKSVYSVVGDVESILENINDGPQVSQASIQKTRAVNNIEPEDIKEELPVKENVEESAPVEEIPEPVKEYVEEKKSRLAAIKDWFLKPWRKKNEHSNRAEQVG